MNELQPGEYEVFPYIQVIQDQLPDDLLLSFGPQADDFSQYFQENNVIT